jgi:EXPERA (EXPanded EBP superfamily)
MADIERCTDANRVGTIPAMAEEKPLPLRKRSIDFVFIAFFVLNLGFITYIVDVEQLIVDDPAKFTYPLWPPARLVDLVHWWGHNFDPVLIARPTWWKATIWIDALLFGPFYAVALYAFVKGREWIRLPSVMWASVMLTNVTIILSEETWGTHATPKLGMVLFANASWVLVPIALIARMWKERPFSPP